MASLLRVIVSSALKIAFLVASFPSEIDRRYSVFRRLTMLSGSAFVEEVASLMLHLLLCPVGYGAKV